MSQVIRVWQLGSLEHKLFPTEQAMNRLAGILIDTKTTDIIWDDTLKVTELKGDGCPNIVCGPGIQITRNGDTVLVAKVEQ